MRVSWSKKRRSSKFISPLWRGKQCRRIDPVPRVKLSSYHGKKVELKFYAEKRDFLFLTYFLYTVSGIRFWRYDCKYLPYLRACFIGCTMTLENRETLTLISIASVRRICIHSEVSQNKVVGWLETRCGQILEAVDSYWLLNDRIFERLT